MTPTSMHWFSMFEQTLKIIAQPSASGRCSLMARLDKARTVNHNFGYGVGDDMGSLIGRYLEQ